MCGVAPSSIEETLRATLAAPEHRSSGAGREDLLAAAGRRGVCAIHAFAALRTLLRNGHVAVQAPAESCDPATDPAARWKIAENPPPAPSSPEEEKRLGNYTYRPAEPLGRGKWGIVYRGWNPYLHRPVAIKVLSREYTDNVNFQRRFAREARFLAQLDHPHIVKLYDGGQAPDGTFYLAMEYIEGGTLREFTRKLGRVPPPLVAKYMYQAAEALAVAHRQGILHRDVKPENLMMSPDGVKLTDFNLAGFDGTALPEVPSAFESVASDAASPPPLVGTLAYMAPERLNGDRGDARSDIYSLGATFYCAAARGLLFEGIAKDSNVYMTWRWHHTKEAPTPLTERVPGFPASLWAVIERTLAKNPDDRYASCEELLLDLAAVRRELSPNEAFAAPPGLKVRRGRHVGLAVRAALAGAGLAALVWAVLPSAPRRQTPALAGKLSPAEPKPAEEKTEPSAPEEPSDPEPPPLQKPQEVHPPPQSLRSRLSAFHPSPNEIAFVISLMDAFAAARAEFLAGSYDAAEKAVRRAPGGEGEYAILHRDAAAGLLNHARGALEIRRAELSRLRTSVTLPLKEGGLVSGRIERADPDALTLRDEKGAVSILRTDRLAPEALAPENAPLESVLAFQVLSWKPAEVLPTLAAASEKEDELVPWLPIAVRLARLEVRSRVEAAVAEARGLLAQGGEVEKSAVALRSYAAAARAAKAALSAESGVLGLYGYLAPEFAEMRRETESLDLLLARRYARILAGFPGSAAHPAAGDLLSSGFRRDLEGAHDELLARTGWFDYRWRLDPPGRKVEETTAHWDLDPAGGGSSLQAGASLKRLLMQEGHDLAPEGMLFRARFEPRAGEEGSGHWRLYLRTDRGGESYLRGSADRVEIYRSCLTPAGRDELLARAALAPPADTQGFREFLLIPGDGYLHLFVDGKVAWGVPAAEAGLPRAVAFGVERGKLSIATVKVRKSK